MATKSKTDSEKHIEDISKKLNALVALQLRTLFNEDDFSVRRKKGTGDLVSYFSNFGLDPKDISEITGSPLKSVRTLLTPTRKKNGK